MEARNTNTPVSKNQDIHRLVKSNDIEAIKSLFKSLQGKASEKKVLLNSTSQEFKYTPFALACQLGYLPIVELLLAEGADINSVNDEFKRTPLMLACQANQKAVVNFLIQANADVRGGIRVRKSSIDFARPYPEIVELLKVPVVKVINEQTKFCQDPKFKEIIQTDKQKYAKLALLCFSMADIEKDEQKIEETRYYNRLGHVITLATIEKLTEKEDPHMSGSLCFRSSCYFMQEGNYKEGMYYATLALKKYVVATINDESNRVFESQLHTDLFKLFAPFPELFLDIAKIYETVSLELRDFGFNNLHIADLTTQNSCQETLKHANNYLNLYTHQKNKNANSNKPFTDRSQEESVLRKSLAFNIDFINKASNFYKTFVEKTVMTDTKTLITKGNHWIKTNKMNEVVNFLKDNYLPLLEIYNTLIPNTEQLGHKLSELIHPDDKGQFILHPSSGLKIPLQVVNGIRVTHKLTYSQLNDVYDTFKVLASLVKQYSWDIVTFRYTMAQVIVSLILIKPPGIDPKKLNSMSIKLIEIVMELDFKAVCSECYHQVQDMEIFKNTNLALTKNVFSFDLLGELEIAIHNTKILDSKEELLQLKEMLSPYNRYYQEFEKANVLKYIPKRCLIGFEVINLQINPDLENRYAKAVIDFITNEKQDFNNRNYTDTAHIAFVALVKHYNLVTLPIQQEVQARDILDKLLKIAEYSINKLSVNEFAGIEFKVCLKNYSAFWQRHMLLLMKSGMAHLALKYSLSINEILTKKEAHCKQIIEENYINAITIIEPAIKDITNDVSTCKTVTSALISLIKHLAARRFYEQVAAVTQIIIKNINKFSLSNYDQVLIESLLQIMRDKELFVNKQHKVVFAELRILYLQRLISVHPLKQEVIGNIEKILPACERQFINKPSQCHEDTPIFILTANEMLANWYLSAGKHSEALDYFMNVIELAANFKIAAFNNISHTSQCLSKINIIIRELIQQGKNQLKNELSYPERKNILMEMISLYGNLGNNLQTTQSSIDATAHQKEIEQNRIDELIANIELLQLLDQEGRFKQVTIFGQQLLSNLENIDQLNKQIKMDNTIKEEYIKDILNIIELNSTKLNDYIKVKPKASLSSVGLFDQHATVTKDQKKKAKKKKTHQSNNENNAAKNKEEKKVPDNIDANNNNANNSKQEVTTAELKQYLYNKQGEKIARVGKAVEAQYLKKGQNALFPVLMKNIDGFLELKYSNYPVYKALKENALSGEFGNRKKYKQLGSGFFEVRAFGTPHRLVGHYVKGDNGQEQLLIDYFKKDGYHKGKNN